MKPWQHKNLSILGNWIKNSRKNTTCYLHVCFSTSIHSTNIYWVLTVRHRYWALGLKLYTKQAKNSCPPGIVILLAAQGPYFNIARVPGKLSSTDTFGLGIGSRLCRVEQGPARCSLFPPGPYGQPMIEMLGLSDLSETFIPNSHDSKSISNIKWNWVFSTVTVNQHLNTVTNCISWAVHIGKIG